MFKLQIFSQFAISSIAGGLSAISLNFFMSRSGAVIFRAADIIDQATGFQLEKSVPVLSAILIILILCAASLIYFRPLGLKGACACGFFVAALVSLFAP